MVMRYFGREAAVDFKYDSKCANPLKNLPVWNCSVPNSSTLFSVRSVKFKGRQRLAVPTIKTMSAKLLQRVLATVSINFQLKIVSWKNYPDHSYFQSKSRGTFILMPKFLPKLKTPCLPETLLTARYFRRFK